MRFGLPIRTCSVEGLGSWLPLGAGLFLRRVEYPEPATSGQPPRERTSPKTAPIDIRNEPKRPDEAVSHTPKEQTDVNTTPGVGFSRFSVEAYVQDFTGLGV